MSVPLLAPVTDMLSAHPISRGLPPLVALVFACSRGGAPAAVARVDTLHPGLIQVTSAAPTGWADSAHAWQYRVTLRIQPGDGSPGELLEPGNLVVDDWGRIYVADRKPAAIKVFDSTGRFMRTIGHEGAGPGEYRVAYLAVRGAHLVVHDPMQSRTSVFDTSGAYLRSWSSSCCYWADIMIDTAGMVYIPSVYTPDSGAKSRGAAYRRFRLDGTEVDTVFVPQRQDESSGWKFSAASRNNRSTMIMNVPFTPMLARRLHPDGGFVLGWTGEYRILRSPGGEDTTVIMTRSWTPGRIPEATRTAAMEKVVANAKGMVGEASAREIAKLSDVPESAPAYQSLTVDPDGNVFARQLVGSDSTRTLYDVFAPTGAWLGAVTVPVAVPEYGGQFFGKRAIYSVSEDEDGRPMILRLTRAP